MATTVRATTAPGDHGHLDRTFLSARPRRYTSMDRTFSNPGHVSRARSASNILDLSTDDFNRRLYDPVLAPHLQRTNPRQTGLAELAAFLKNQAPPPDNFMSIPDYENDEKRRWLKWVKKSRSGPKPPPIRLPDTAVSGKTIGGHRHIAITIPFEAFPMGERPRSQYPVYRESTNAPKTITNEKGVVTVLKTVRENAGESEAWTYGPSRPLPRTPSTNTNRQNMGGFFGTWPSRGQDEPRRPATTQSSDSAFPTRTSSKANKVPHQHISIDGLLSRDGYAGMARNTERVNAGSDAKGTKAAKVDPTPTVVHDLDLDEDDNGIEGVSRSAQKMENPLGSRQSTAPELNRAQSRRDKVRDRKRRDIEALVSSKKSAERNSSVQLTFSSIQSMSIEPEEPRLESTALVAAAPSDSRHDEQIKAAQSSQLTPPRSPVTKPVALDRTSLQRRREWKQSRQVRCLSSESRAAVRARAKELIAADEADTSTQALDREILRLYEAYREHRFNDMERRVRLLERNGDVWLRALVPVLKGLNARDPSRGYMSDEEMPRSRPASVALRRAQSSHRSLRGCDAIGRSDEDNVDGGTDGLDTVEPLMRELAGAARARQMRAARV